MNFHAWISERVHDAFIFVSNLFICIFVFLIPFPTYLDIFLTPFPMYLHVFLIFFSLYLHLFCIPTYLCIRFSTYLYDTFSERAENILQSI